MVGTWIFLPSCVGAWALFAPSIAPSHFDPVQGVLGSLGWALFAIAWGGQRAPPQPRPLADLPPATRPAAQTRRKLAFGLLVTCALAPLALSWWVVSVERALLAHAVSLAAAIVLIVLAVDLLAPVSPIENQSAPEPRERPLQRWQSAAPALVMLVMLALAGAAYGLLR